MSSKYRVPDTIKELIARLFSKNSKQYSQY